MRLPPSTRLREGIVQHRLMFLFFPDAPYAGQYLPNREIRCYPITFAQRGGIEMGLQMSGALPSEIRETNE